MTTATIELDEPLESETPKSWHALDIQSTLARIDTDLAHGLSSDEVSRRLHRYGYNTIQTSRESKWYQVLGRQFLDVLIFILLVAAAISLAVGDVTDAIAILAIIVLNGTLGFVQEWKAERALAALKQMLTPACRVIRQGNQQQIEATNLVPGDIVLLEAGDRVPADLRLLDAVDLTVDESVLTGESFSVEKQAEPVGTKAPLA